METDATFRLIRASTELIRLGKELFRSRGDKEWPLTDCISFVVMLRLNQRGVRETVRPSGHNIRSGFTEISSGGSISSNVIEEAEAEDMLKFRNNAANDNYTLRCKEAGLKIHPARFPAALPEFFVKLLTDESDIVYDPFAGSNTPGAVAEKLERRWLASENVQDYLEASKFRFE